MKWQVKYALENLGEGSECIGGELVKIQTGGQPDVIAAISDKTLIDEATAKNYHENEPNLDFICGFRKECIWNGAAITYLERRNIGWGNLGTLSSAAAEGTTTTSSHKVYFFSDRLYHQTRWVVDVEREFDRVHSVTLKSGTKLRIGMIAEYEPTVDAVRSFWETFGAVDVLWNINPNGNPTESALKAGSELGCKVVKWDELKSIMIKG